MTALKERARGNAWAKSAVFFCWERGHEGNNPPMKKIQESFDARAGRLR